MLNFQQSLQPANSGKFSFEEKAWGPNSQNDKSMRKYTYENNQLLEDNKPLKATIHCSEMPREMECWAVDCAAIALINRADIKEAAAYIKKEFDKQFGPTWHCVVGSNFGR
ncbi:unnamed protein product [Mesocestoides corti]|uniref:Dynein light chain n=1 Tax=Mesocestoides corti TaxID=53468 RepID=A0A0R3U6D6_MESCO|nr:unnamed protein product [Mesocestoides corti]